MLRYKFHKGLHAKDFQAPGEASSSPERTYSSSKYDISSFRGHICLPGSGSWYRPILNSDPNQVRVKNAALWEGIVIVATLDVIPVVNTLWMYCTSKNKETRNCVPTLCI